jgi:hypothetical protein
MVASGQHRVGAADTHEKEFSMKLIKPVVTPRITPVTAASLKQVVGGLRGATGGGKAPIGGADGSGYNGLNGG